MSNRQISKTIGIHRNSVNHYVRLFQATDRSYSSLLTLSDQGLETLFPVSNTIDKTKYEELSSYFSYFRNELKKPGCTRQVLWKEYQSKHPQGYGYSQFNLHFKRWLNRLKTSGKLIHKAGDKIYIDYCGKKLNYVDKATGEIIEVEVFVGIRKLHRFDEQLSPLFWWCSTSHCSR